MNLAGKFRDVTTAGFVLATVVQEVASLKIRRSSGTRGNVFRQLSSLGFRGLDAKSRSVICRQHVQNIFATSRVRIRIFLLSAVYFRVIFNCESFTHLLTRIKKDYSRMR